MSHVVVVLSFEVRSSSCFFFSVENCVSAQFRCVALASRWGVCKDLPRVGQDQHLHYLVFGVCDLFSWELFTVKCVLSDFFILREHSEYSIFRLSCWISLETFFKAGRPP